LRYLKAGPITGRGQGTEQLDDPGVHVFAMPNPKVAAPLAADELRARDAAGAVLGARIGAKAVVASADDQGRWADGLQRARRQALAQNRIRAQSRGSRADRQDPAPQPSWIRTGTPDGIMIRASQSSRGGA
jgi:hypothetical protein